MDGVNVSVIGEKWLKKHFHDYCESSQVCRGRLEALSHLGIIQQREYVWNIAQDLQMGGRGSKNHLPHGRLAFGLFSLLTSLLPFLGVIFIFLINDFYSMLLTLKGLTLPSLVAPGFSPILSIFFFLNSNKIVTEFSSKLVSKFFY